jgi:hypothetical protein
MTSRLYFLSILLFAASCFGATATSVSEEKALAIIRALPEFADLKQRLGDDVHIDGPLQITPAPVHQVCLGSKAWQVDVYITVHDNEETDHGTRWAFFRVSALSGDVWVDDFDFHSGSFVLRSLEGWRLERKKPNQPSQPTPPSRHG